MRRLVLCGLLIVAVASSAVKADVIPPGGRRDTGPPPPPPGPDRAVIRGVTVAKAYSYWRGRRWMTIIEGCESRQAGCKGNALQGCFVTGVDGLPIDGGDIASLTAKDKSAEAGSIKLMLDHCELSEIDLGR